MDAELMEGESSAIDGRLAMALRAPLALLVDPSSKRALEILRHVRRRMPGAVLYELAPAQRSYRGLARGLTLAVSAVAPGARYAFALAFSQAADAADPFMTLTRWMRHHLGEKQPLVLIGGLADVEGGRADFMRLIATLARERVMRFLVAVATTDDLPLAAWMADALTTLPVDARDIEAWDEDAVSDADGPATQRIGRRDTLEGALQAGDRDIVTTLLVEYGFRMLDLGDADIVDDALVFLGQRETHPIIAALIAMRESHKGRMDIAEAWFETALDLASDPLERAEIAQRLAIDFMRKGRPDVVRHLWPLVSDESLPVEIRAETLAMLAESEAEAARLPNASALLITATALDPKFDDPYRFARWHGRRAYVLFWAREFDAAVHSANRAIEIAEANGFHYIAMSALSILKNVAYERSGPNAALPYIYAIANNAERSANMSMHAYALVSAYEMEAERAHLQAVRALEAALEPYDVQITAPHVVTGYVPVKAMVVAWAGRFGLAASILAPLVDLQYDPRLVALHSAALALYYAASDDAEKSRASLTRFVRATEGQTVAERSRVLARAFAQLAAVLLGDDFPQDDVASAREPDVDVAVHVYAAFARGQAASDELLASFDALDAAQYGGLAKLIAALPTEFERAH